MAYRLHFPCMEDTFYKNLVITFYRHGYLLEEPTDKSFTDRGFLCSLWDDDRSRTLRVGIGKLSSNPTSKSQDRIAQP